MALTAVLVWSFVRTPSLPDLLPAPVSPLLPDLAMSPLQDISAVQIKGSGDYVQFTAAVANVGVGAFIVHAVRGDRRGAWRVSQRFQEPDGSTSETVTKGDVVWGGHGHDHWHVHLGASYWITRPSSSERLRRYDKVGFCFFDQRPLLTQPTDRAGAPAVPEDRVQRPEHARVHDGPVTRMGRPVPLGSPGPAPAPDGSPGRRLPPLGDRGPGRGGSARRTRRTTRRGSTSG